MSSEFSVQKVLVDFAKENKTTLTTYFFLSLAFPINTVILPYYYGKVIDQASKSKRKEIWTNTRRTIGIIGILWVVKQVLINRLDSLDASFLPKLQSHIRKNLVLRILEIHKDDYKDPEVGRLLTHITKLPYIVRDLFYQARFFILPIALVVLTTWGYLTYLHPHLGLIYMFGILMFIGLVYWFYKSSFELSARKEKVYLQLSEDIVDLLANMLNVYSSATVEEEMIRIEKRQEDLDKKYREAVQCAANFKTLFNILYMFIFASINGYTFYLYSQGKISLGSLTSVLMVTLYVINMLESASAEMRDFAANIGVLKRAQCTVNEMGIPPPRMDERDLKSGEIIVENLEVKYGDNIGLKIDFLHILPKECVAIIGKTGCGKSTFTKALTKLIPYEGTITIGGIDIRRVSHESLRKQVIYVPQQPRLFNRSILENITYGSDVSREEVEIALEDLGIYLGDLNRLAGKNGNNLSGGQKQLVYFLRFLFRKGSIVILDEPTASLDGETRNQVLRILKYVSQGRTTIIVTHDPEVMQFSTREIHL